MHRVFSSAVAVAVLLGTAGRSDAGYLSAISVYSADSAGSPTGGLLWDTTVGNFAYDAFTRVNGSAFLTDGTTAFPGVNLVAGSSYDFEMFGENGGASRPFFGLNLFFDGLANPSISVVAAEDRSPTSDPSYSTIAPGTMTWGQFVGATGGGHVLLVPASGVSSFLLDPHTRVTLTAFNWGPSTENYGPGGLDAVWRYKATPDTQPDGLGGFRLDVTAVAEASSAALVPEPGTLALMGVGSLGMALGAWRKRRQA